MAIRTPRGTRDFVPDEMEKWRAVENTMRNTAETFGYREITTPTFENIELFTLKSGQSIVNEIYAFKDKGNRDMALRPELTAPVMRFYINSLQSMPKPLKLYYFGNCFRYEEPQAGRYREFWQFGVETIGSESSEANADIIALADALCRNTGLKNYEICIGDVGIYKFVLKEAGLLDREGVLKPFVDKRDKDGLIAKLREIGAMEAGAKIVKLIDLTGAPADVLPKVKDMLGDAGKSEYGRLEQLVGLLKLMKIDFILEMGIVRGLDYYTGAVFQIRVKDLSAQNEVCGGGSYRLAELLGGGPTETTGFAFGFDRLLNSLKIQKHEIQTASGVDAFIIPMGAAAKKEAIKIVTALRSAGIRADIDLVGRSIGKNLKYANSINAKRALIIGDDELKDGVVTIRNMKSGEQESVPIKEISAHIKTGK